jgi:hypothetical protein
MLVVRQRLQRLRQLVGKGVRIADIDLLTIAETLRRQGRVRHLHAAGIARGAARQSVSGVPAAQRAGALAITGCGAGGAGSSSFDATVAIIAMASTTPAPMATSG